MRQTYAVKLFIAAIRNSTNQRLTASHTELMGIMLIGERGVYKLVKRLEKLGLISVSRAQNQSNTYSINPKYYEDK